MKKACLFLLVAATWLTLSAEENDKKGKYKNEPRDRLVIGFTADNWFHQVDSLSTKWNSWGFQMQFMYDMPLGKSPFSFAPGIGISASWVKNNSYLDDSDSNRTIFREWNTLGATYKRNSLATVYLDVPLELRYRSTPNKKGKSFKLGIGVVTGIRMNAHTKTKSSDENVTGSTRDQTQIIRANRWGDISLVRFGPTFRIGIGSINLVATYYVTSLFKSGQGPKINPFSIGISINGL